MFAFGMAVVEVPHATIRERNRFLNYQRFSSSQVFTGKVHFHNTISTEASYKTTSGEPKSEVLCGSRSMSVVAGNVIRGKV